MNYPNPEHSARRNLAQRIERFVARLETVPREPTAYEGDCVLTALGLLAAGECRDGEDAMFEAERPDIVTPDQLARRRGETPTTSHLRARLAAVKREAGL